MGLIKFNLFIIHFGAWGASDETKTNEFCSSRPNIREKELYFFAYIKGAIIKVHLTKKLLICCNASNFVVMTFRCCLNYFVVPRDMT